MVPGTSGVAGRVAWLLRVNRLLGENEEWAKTSTFAAAFRGGTHVTRISESTVSRWETAAARVPLGAVRRYEELLGLAPGTLVAMVDTINRYSAPAATGPPVLSRAGLGRAGSEGHARLEELIERSASSDAMSGLNWDELTGKLSALPWLVIMPSSLWADMAARLLEEMIVADGLPWMQRFEAFNRMLGHPAGQRAAVAVCASLVADPANQVFVEPVSVLDASAHPDASRHVLAQLAHPTNARTRYGALLACVRKVRYGHFVAEQLSGLVPIVLEMLLDPDSVADASALGVELLRRMPAGMVSGADASLRRALASDRGLHEVLAAGRLARPAISSVVVDRIVAAARAELGREAPGFTDDLLPTLVDEMLYAPVLDVRLYAAMLIGATPYRPAVAAALAGELTGPRVAGDGRLSSSLLGAVRVVGGAAQRPLVERLVLAPGLPPEVSAAAVHSIAHVGGVSSDRFWLTAIALYGRTWRRHRDAHSAAALSDLVYGLGIARNLRLLERVRDDAAAPGPVRASAAWWLSRPMLVYASAGR